MSAVIDFTTIYYAWVAFRWKASMLWLANLHRFTSLEFWDEAVFCLFHQKNLYTTNKFL